MDMVHVLDEKEYVEANVWFVIYVYLNEKLRENLFSHTKYLTYSSSFLSLDYPGMEVKLIKV